MAAAGVGRGRAAVGGAVACCSRCCCCRSSCRASRCPTARWRRAAAARWPRPGSPSASCGCCTWARRRRAANAMVAGLGPTPRIYVGDTLSADARDGRGGSPRPGWCWPTSWAITCTATPGGCWPSRRIGLARRGRGRGAGGRGAGAGRAGGADRAAVAGARVLARLGASVSPFVRLVLAAPRARRRRLRGRPSPARASATRRARAAGRAEPVRASPAPAVAPPAHGLASHAGRADRRARAATRRKAGQD